MLLANEPRAYREVIAETIRSLRPEIEVLEAEPASLEESLRSLAPDMVVCARSPGPACEIPVWVELYPGGGPVSVVSVAGGRREIEGIELREILALVDRADTLAQAG